VEKDMARFYMRRWSIPSIVNHLHETGDPNPKVFELEGARPSGASIIGKQERAMIRQRRRQGIEHMRPKAHVPHIIAIEGIELAQGRIFPLVTPSETPVLKMDLMELTSLESGSKTVDASTVDIHVAFIPSPANLVEVTKYQPLRPRRGLVGNKLGEKIVLPIVRRWTVHRCDLEITITIAVR
jgi:hypothetical protein